MALQDELGRAQTHIRNHILNFINSSSLKCAVQLGIPDVIHRHGRPMTLEELVDALAINKAKADHLGRLMRVLTRTGIFIKDDDGYALGPPSCLLIKDHPFSMAPFALGATGPTFTGPWQHVSEWFHNDDPTPYQTAYGKTFWDRVSQDPEFNHHFNQAMASNSLLVMSLVKKYCREVFEGLDSLVDVGGGTGMVARALADEFPDMKCSVLDLPHVVAGLEGTKNLVYVAGNMFEVIPPAQAVVLKMIMHNWNDEDCVTILKNCKEAIPNRENGGKVIILDMIMGSTQNRDDDNDDDDELIQTQIFADVHMMVNFGGRERKLKEWVKIFNDAGFTDYKTTQLGLMSLIQLFP
ncbi:PREDICTED: trans-resveratrol di-O-methyltransferase-like [Ipomoea nil]|uniref:trans-resveratrol di-O-methyltransferase-like n=1 Tax=Ipomoea nil TaxID=35883 RepID=UPI00090191DF|nr:PREDICTED: trans-resveratrol di-O-methyltransferase-like [Ipomoea nil]XP_019149917.1 PREDICTED: trans-resveratrol di-O-methyltransferase-like [Ipomoea nil]